MNKKIKFVVILFIMIIPTILIGCKNENKNGDLPSEQITISFNTNGGTEVASQQIDIGSKITEPENCEKKGYILDGWYLNNEKWSFIGYTATENICLEAKWSPINYSIEYIIQGSQQHPDNPQTYTIEDELIVLKEPVQNFDLIFDGWYLDEEFTQKVNTIDCNLCVNITLYPKWTDEFHIRTQEEFLEFSTNTILHNKNIFLENDINFNNQVIEPITSFSGKFNGNGFKLSNFILNSIDENCGLFLQVDNAEFKNLAIENFTINQSSESICTGVLISKSNDSVVENCYSNNGIFNITCEQGIIGGLIGSFSATHKEVYINNCYAEFNISTNANTVGGLIGNVSGVPYWIQTKQVLISNCYSRCNIKSMNDMGLVSGLIGRTSNEGIKVTNCFSLSNLESGTTKLVTSKLSGIVRFLELDEILIENCYFINNAILKENNQEISNLEIFDAQRIAFDSYENIKNKMKLLWNNDWTFEDVYPKLKVFQNKG